MLQHVKLQRRVCVSDLHLSQINHQRRVSHEAHKLPHGRTLLSPEVRQLYVSLNSACVRITVERITVWENSRAFGFTLTSLCRRRVPHERDRVHLEERALIFGGGAAGVVQPAAVRPDRTDGVQREAQVQHG